MKVIEPCNTNDNVQHPHLRDAQTFADTRFKNRVNSLGIPVDNLNCKETVDAVFQLINDYEQDRIPKLVATLNVDFLVNSLGYQFDKPRHPELLNILRGADLVTADGFPIVVLSKISGFPLKERVTGADLTPALATEAAKRGRSVYLLGGAGDSAKKAAALLKKDNPELHIAGTDAPFVHVTGDKLATWEEDDEVVVNAINKSGADILFMAFGNPKQELWFSRNKHRLQVPVSIGIGGTFAFITGEVRRAPKWIQRANLEWVFRMTQDPKRLVKRYAIGLVKFGFLTVPLLEQRFQRGWDTHVDDQAVSIGWQAHWASRDDALKTLRLPPRVSRGYLEALVTELQQEVSASSVSHQYLIDFSRVEGVAMSANEAFCELARMFSSGRCQGLMIGLSKPLTRRLARARIVDWALGSMVSIEQMRDSISGTDKTRGASQLKTYSVGEACLNYFSGELSGKQLETTGFESSVLDIAQRRSCIIDVRRVTQVDSSALAILLRIANTQAAQNLKPIRLSGITPVIHQMLKVLEISGAFETLDDGAFYDQLFDTPSEASSAE